MNKSLVVFGSLFAASAVLSACSHGLPQSDLRSAEAKQAGYMVSGQDAHERGGIGNYVPKVCSQGGWGLPAKNCSAPASAAVRAEKPVSHSQASPVRAPVLGGATGKKQIRLDVLFNPSSAEIANAEQNELDALAATLKDNPSYVVRIEGYTDSTGQAAKNEKLSQARAEEVRGYLIGRGVGAKQLVAKGFGPQQPVASNATAAGRAKNRRVMATLIQE